MRIPFVDLSLQNRAVADEVRQAMDAVIAASSFILGPPVAEFEGTYARYCRARHCVGVANGTDALELAVRACGLGPGDEVVLPANTFVATALAVARAGAIPVLADVDPHTHLIDPDEVSRRIGPRTRAIIPVHLYGQVAPMEALSALAAEHGLKVIEDAAQAQGASRGGQVAGSIGDVAATSFYPGKNLGAFGDAGALTTDDGQLAERVRRLRNYGSERKYHHPETGFNSRLDTLQAVVLSAKLKRLDGWNEERRAAAARYDALLEGVSDVTRPCVAPDSQPVWHLYVVRVPERDRLLAALEGAGIQALVHYPTPFHLQGAFAHLGHGRGDFPVTERASQEILSLPLYPGITAAQQAEVAEALKKALG